MTKKMENAFFLPQIEISNTKKENNQYNINSGHIKDILKEKDVILNLSFLDEILIKEIANILKNDCFIISLKEENEESLEEQKNFFEQKNILIEKIKFKNNFLKDHSIDLLLAKNFLHSKNNIKEMNRILKPKGRFLFLEIVSNRKPRHGFKKYFIKNDNIFNTVIFNLSSKLKQLKNAKYEIKVLGNGKFYFNEQDIKKLQDFCDVEGFSTSDRQDILSEIFIVMIKGYICNS